MHTFIFNLIASDSLYLVVTELPLELGLFNSYNLEITSNPVILSVDPT